MSLLKTPFFKNRSWYLKKIYPLIFPTKSFWKFSQKSIQNYFAQLFQGQKSQFNIKYYALI